MTIIYAVIQGLYSDQHIAGLFDNREDADHLVSQGSDMRVEEHELNPTSYGDDRLIPFYIEMGRDGNSWITIGDKEDARREKDTFVCHYNPPNPGEQKATLVLTVLARNKEHAIKIANEHRTVLIDRWPPLVYKGYWPTLPNGEMRMPAWE